MSLYVTDNGSSTVKTGPALYVVSGGTGATGQLLARTVLAQFPHVNVPLEIRSRVTDKEKIQAVIAEAAAAGKNSVILHTMVSAEHRHFLEMESEKAGLWTFDLAGQLMRHLSEVLDEKPLEQPGYFYRMNRAYFDRIDAIEFAVSHDDGKRIEDLPRAEIILLGVSRVGKTPLSMYLSMLGWKVANVPLVFPDVAPPADLFTGNKRRLVGLMIEPAQLIAHRKSRAARTGIPEGSYVGRDEVVEELRAASHFFYRHEIPIVNTTDKPIESCAEEVLEAVTGRRGVELLPR
jgi:hypothetical protein